jgi:hypothetical protein
MLLSLALWIQEIQATDFFTYMVAVAFFRGMILMTHRRLPGLALRNHPMWNRRWESMRTCSPFCIREAR